jgi:hypothetical protein
MFIESTYVNNDKPQFAQIYNDLEWHSQLYYNTDEIGPCYWFRTPKESNSYLGFLVHHAKSVDHDGGNQARSVVFCIGI